MIKIKGITEKERKAIAEYEELLLKKFPRRIREIILFGSKSRGDFSQTSDIDLLIVVSRDGKKIRNEITALTHEPVAKYLVDLSPIIVEEDFFKEWSPLLKHIKKDSITIWTNKSKKSM